MLAFASLTGIAGDKKAKDGKKESAKSASALLDEKGELKKADQAKSYTVKLEAGKIYRIELKSDKFDAHLKLEAAGKSIAEDDDSAGSLNARLYYKAAESREYTVVVSSRNKQGGAFTLEVMLATDRNVASEFPNKTIELKWADGKTKFKGLLDQNDANSNGRYYKVFAVSLEEGKSYQFDQRSDDFDAYLILEDADGKRLAANDDGGKGVNARLTFTPAKTAAYRIIATSLPTRQMGTFVLDIAPVDKQAGKK